MPNWMLAITIGLAVLLPALAWLWLVRLRGDETRDGLKALAAMSWRDFSSTVLAALRDRGLQEMPEADSLPSPEPQPGILLTRHDERWLLACKHGSAYRIGADTVAELGEAARLRNATGAILATEGQVAPDGIAAAQRRNIEVLAGRPLWLALKPHLPPALRAHIETLAQARARRHSWIAGLASMALACIVAAFVPANVDETPVPAAQATSRHALVPPQDRKLQAVLADGPMETDENVLKEQRATVSKTLMTVPGVIRGFWISKLTLVVDRSGEDAMVWPLVCRELERYPALRTSRVQMNPPVGSDEPVRWRQCKTF